MTTRIVELRQGILKKNDELARGLRGRFEAAGVLVFNLVSSPGTGKTAFLERTLRLCARRGASVAALVGDLETDNDARRLAASGAPVRQINTHGICHLDAEMVGKHLDGWEGVDLAGLDYLFIENVGNLVCPSSYDLGERIRVALLSVTEGEDKPLKYPTLFNSADAAVITKIDIAEAVGFDRETAFRNIRAIRPGIRIFETSAKTGAGHGRHGSPTSPSKKPLPRPDPAAAPLIGSFSGPVSHPSKHRVQDSASRQCAGSSTKLSFPMSAAAADARPLPQPAPVAAWKPKRNPWLIAITVTLATFMEVLDTSIANVALPHIAGGLGASVDEATWVLTSYLVANAVILPASAYLTTFLGRKRFYMICVVLFGISSALCGLAPSLGLLIFFRVLQGAGGGGLAPSEQAILADTFPPEKRGQAFALYGLAVVVRARHRSHPGWMDHRQLRLALDASSSTCPWRFFRCSSPAASSKTRRTSSKK